MPSRPKFHVMDHCVARYIERTGAKGITPDEARRRIVFAIVDGRPATLREARDIVEASHQWHGGERPRYGVPVTFYVGNGMVFVLAAHKQSKRRKAVLTCWPAADVLQEAVA